MKLNKLVAFVITPILLMSCSNENQQGISGTLTDSRLQASLMPLVGTTVRANTSCKEDIGLQNVKKMYVTRPYNGQSWSEHWVVRACQKDYDVDINFSTHPVRGTSFNVAMFKD
ncbi:MAG: hypothetical protein K0M45_11015 [Candidatus Paracaedibacteraceae bacterium]|nr:hypothetical protein [Candidatus Paracaedibacteraceae bacterium]